MKKYYGLQNLNSSLEKKLQKVLWRIFLIFFGLGLFYTYYNFNSLIQNDTRIIIITPTYYRKQRLPDLIR